VCCNKYFRAFDSLVKLLRVCVVAFIVCCSANVSHTRCVVTALCELYDDDDEMDDRCLMCYNTFSRVNLIVLVQLLCACVGCFCFCYFAHNTSHVRVVL